MYLIWWDDRVVGYVDSMEDALDATERLIEDDPVVAPHLHRIEKVEWFDPDAPRYYAIPNVRYYPNSHGFRDRRVVMLDLTPNPRPSLVVERVGSREWFVRGGVVASRREDAERLVRRKATELYQWCRAHRAVSVTWDAERDVITDWTERPDALDAYFVDEGE